MAIHKQRLMGFMLGATALGALAALPVRAEPVAQNLNLHDMDGIAEAAGREAVGNLPAQPASSGPVTADMVAGDNAVTMGPRTAAEAAHDSAAETAICDNYFLVSQSLGAALSPAVKAMTAHDMATLSTLLPVLQTQLDQLPADEIHPELCGGTHINAYTRQQYFELSVLRLHHVDTGFPADLPLVKQPDLNQGALAFVVGWIRFEQKDYTGALAAFGRGLAMFPHDHGLQNEYAVTLLALKDSAQEVAFDDSVLNGTYDLDDRERSNYYAGRGTGLLMLHALDAADQSYTLSLRYNYTPQVKAMQDQLRAARAGRAPAATPAPVPVPAPAQK